ncbi:MAG: lipopolysaccharide kinase InaA family protein [Candidatus Binatia bacterium]
MSQFVPWAQDGWCGHVDPALAGDVTRCLALAASGEGRRSRHARTAALVTAAGTVFVKSYPAPAGWRAERAFRMGAALTAVGLGAPEAVLLGRRGREGLLVTRDVGGMELMAAVAEVRAPERRGQKRALLRGLGAAVGRLHDLGFVHGDLVPSNVRVRAGEIVFLDHDRTRRAALLVWFGGRRNLVQLGRFVVAGVTATDRARVLAGYAAVRGLSPAVRRRLVRWVVAKTIVRRCAIDGIAPEAARRAGFREVMRSGGPFDPARRSGRAA